MRSICVPSKITAAFPRESSVVVGVPAGFQPDGPLLPHAIICVSRFVRHRGAGDAREIEVNERPTRQISNVLRSGCHGVTSYFEVRCQCRRIEKCGA